MRALNDAVPEAETLYHIPSLLGDDIELITHIAHAYINFCLDGVLLPLPAPLLFVGEDSICSCCGVQQGVPWGHTYTLKILDHKKLPRNALNSICLTQSK